MRDNGGALRCGVLAGRSLAQAGTSGKCMMMARGDVDFGLSEDPSPGDAGRANRSGRYYVLSSEQLVMMIGLTLRLMAAMAGRAMSMAVWHSV